MEKLVHRSVRKVEFADTDASGWMHFPNVFRYAEAAEHEFLIARGIAVFDRSRGGWPRVSVHCDYVRPLRAGDPIEVLLGIVRIGTSSIQWQFELLSDDGEIAASGKMTTVRVDSEGRKTEIPAEEREALES